VAWAAYLGVGMMNLNTLVGKSRPPLQVDHCRFFFPGSRTLEKGNRTHPSQTRHLGAESVEGFALFLQSIDHIHGSHCLAASMLSVGDSVADDFLQEDLEATTSLFIDEATDALDATTTGKATDGGLGDPLDVITEDPSVSTATYRCACLWTTRNTNVRLNHK
jgi:hypothetical protein